MLQRKLLVLLGSVVVLLVGVAVATVLLLQATLADLNASTAQAIHGSAAMLNIGRALTSVEAALELRAAGAPVSLEQLGRDLETLERLARDLPRAPDGPSTEDEQRLGPSLASLREHVAAIGAATAPADTGPPLAACAEVRATVDALTRLLGADLVVRYSGGAQAGHNVQLADGERHTFAQFGAGTLAGARTFLGPRMIIAPATMVPEADHLRELGVPDPWSLLTVHPDCLVSTFYHMLMNRMKLLPA